MFSYIPSMEGGYPIARNPGVTFDPFLGRRSCGPLFSSTGQCIGKSETGGPNVPRAPQKISLLGAVGEFEIEYSIVINSYK